MGKKELFQVRKVLLYFNSQRFLQYYYSKNLIKIIENMSAAVKEAPAEEKPSSKMEEDNIDEDEDEGLMAEVKKMSTDEINARARLLDNEIRIMRADIMRIQHEMQTQKDKIKENTEKIKVNKTLPYLVSNVIEILD